MWSAGEIAKAVKIDLPTSDVIQWPLADWTKVTARPSGIEPKIKFYVLLRSDARGGAAGLPAAREESGAKAAAICCIRPAPRGSGAENGSALDRARGYAERDVALE
jgi:hypothetical protein